VSELVKNIQRYPRGILSLLGVQNAGESPAVLDPRLQAVVDISSFFQTDRLSISGGTTAAVAAVGYAPTTGLNGPSAEEMWLVHSVDVRPSAALGAATAYGYQVALLSRGNVHVLSDFVASAVGEEYAATVIFNNPLILQSGDSLGVWVPRVNLGIAATFLVSERVMRLTY